MDVVPSMKNGCETFFMAVHSIVHKLIPVHFSSWSAFHVPFQSIIHFSIWSITVYSPLIFMVHSGSPFIPVFGPYQSTGSLHSIFHGLWSTPIHWSSQLFMVYFCPLYSLLSTLIHGILQSTLVHSGPLKPSSASDYGPLQSTFHFSPQPMYSSPLILLSTSLLQYTLRGP